MISDCRPFHDQMRNKLYCSINRARLLSNDIPNTLILFKIHVRRILAENSDSPHLVAQQPRPVVENCGNVGVISAQGFLEDLLCPLVQRLRFRVPTLCSKQLGGVSEWPSKSQSISPTNMDPSKFGKQIFDSHLTLQQPRPDC